MTEFDIGTKPITHNGEEISIEYWDQEKYFLFAKNILSDYFDNSQQSDNNYIEAYNDPPDSFVLHHYYEIDGKAVGRITISKFDRSGITMGLATLYLDTSHSNAFTKLFSIIIDRAKEEGCEKIQCYISGISRKQLE